MHLMDRLMERQLDRAGRRAAAGARSKRTGIEFMLGRDRGDRGRWRVEAVRLGTAAPCRPTGGDGGRHPARDRARRAQRRPRGRARHRGRRRAARPLIAGIYAIGECAEHRGVGYGLVAPALEQARFSPRLAGGDARYAGLRCSRPTSRSPASPCSRPATSRARTAPRRSCSATRAPASTRSCVVRDGRLVGAVLFGDTADGAWYLDLIALGAADRGDPRRPRLRPRLREARRRCSRPRERRRFHPEQKHYLRASWPALKPRARRAACAAAPAGGGRAVRTATRCAPARRRTGSWPRAASSPPRSRPSASEHPLDIWDATRRQRAATTSFPKGIDVFRWNYPRPVLRRAGAGLLHVPAAHPERHPQRLAVRGVADLAERYGGGYAHVTTRANLQIREIQPEHGRALLEGLGELGLCRAAPAPTTSATSPAARPPASTRRS